MQDLTDTIAAVSTAPGEGGIGIVRVSGPKAGCVLEKIFLRKGSEKIRAEEMANRFLSYGKIFDPDTGRHVDEVLAVLMKGPGTYTGENVCEIQCHGSHVSLRRILDLTLKHGARPAEPGEFTKRAFINGRLDLSQAEAVIDLIKADTDKTFDVALDQLEGRLGERVRELRNRLTDLLVQITVNIDYPDEDIEEILYKDLTKSLSSIGDDIEKLLDTADTGRIISSGFLVTITGCPNVGKSSLMNALLGEERAIVTDIPGTTRDTINEAISVDGIKILLTDTAGIRDTENPVEKIGVEKSKDSFNKADLVVLVLDGSRPLSDDDLDIMDRLRGRRAVVLINKGDLEQQVDPAETEKLLPGCKIIQSSLINNRGPEELKEAIKEEVYGGRVIQKEDVVITNARHKALLREAEEALRDAEEMALREEALDFIEVDVNRGYKALGEMLGEEVTDDILEQVFARFCLGK